MSVRMETEMAGMKSRWWRTSASAIVACASAVVVAQGFQSPAMAVACADGDRAAAARLAATGQFKVPVNVVYSGGAKVELRYATDGSRCVWGLVSQTGYGSDVWIDRSFDRGRTWQPQLGRRVVAVGNSSTYTGLFNDAGVVSRACGSRPGNPVVCTAWY